MPASRPYWNGYLKLSFVSCPIALYPAISAAERVSFRQVNRRTGHRLKHKLVDSITGEAVDATEMARGYDVGENEFLQSEDRDLERARSERPAEAGAVELAAPRRESPPIAPAGVQNDTREGRAGNYDDEAGELEEAAPIPRPQNTRTSEIGHFVPAGQVDAGYFEKPYYIVPRGDRTGSVRGDPRCDESGSRCRPCPRGAVLVRAGVFGRANGWWASRYSTALCTRTLERVRIFQRDSGGEAAFRDDEARTAHHPDEIDRFRSRSAGGSLPQRAPADPAQETGEAPRSRLPSNRRARTSSTLWMRSGAASTPDARQSPSAAPGSRPRRSEAHVTGQPLSLDTYRLALTDPRAIFRASLRTEALEEPPIIRKVHLRARRGGNVLLVESPDNGQAIVDPRDAAESAGLRYVSDERAGIRRKRAGTGFSYTQPDGSRLIEPDALARIRALAIPPAWTDVWICPFADGHIQATGRDAKGRKQYRYHTRFREVRESTKYEHVTAFAEALPSIREIVREHMGLRGLAREKVLATVVHLLETTLIRVGNDDYARQNNSYGLTTLKTTRQGRAERSAFPLHRQKRQTMVAARAGSAHRQDHSSLSGAPRARAASVRR